MAVHTQVEVRDCEHEMKLPLNRGRARRVAATTNAMSSNHCSSVVAIVSKACDGGGGGKGKGSSSATTWKVELPSSF